MSIGDSIALVSCLAGLMVALPGLIIFLTIIFNRTTERAAARLSQGAIIPFIVGLISVIMAGYISLSLISLGSIFQLFGDIAILLLLTWMFAGIGAVSRFIALRIAQMHQQPGDSIRERVIGIFMLTFAIAFPLVGWFMVLPLSFIVGSGAMILALINRSPALPAQRATPIPLPSAPEFAPGD